MGSNIRKGDTAALNPPVYGDAAQWPAVAKGCACGTERAGAAVVALFALCSIRI
jgi:hypothetical protein